MTNQRADAALSSDVAANRRWLIGILITLLFGGFGAVMAWLSYVRRDKATSTPAARARPAAVTPSEPAPDREPEAEPASQPDRDGDREPRRHDGDRKDR